MRAEALLVLVAKPEPRHALTPEDALDAAADCVAVGTPDEIADAAWILAGLAANTAFLTEEINRDLEAALTGKTTKTYSPQSMLIGGNQKVALRANFWFPASSTTANKVIENQTYSYELAHDHNFTFSTIGYVGPGYDTDVYQYDRSGVTGLVGEHVSFSPRRRERLEKGKVLVFESCRDVHVQFPPSQLSISINMIVSDRAELLKPQYLFDLDPPRIAGFAESPLLKRLYLLKFAAEVGNEETAHLVTRLLAQTREPITRAGCYYAGEHLSNDPAAFTHASVLEDDLVVRYIEFVRAGVV